MSVITTTSGTGTNTNTSTVSTPKTQCNNGSSLFLNISIGILSLISTVYTMCYFDLNSSFSVITFTFPALISVFSNIDILISSKSYNKKIRLGIRTISIIILSASALLGITSLLLNSNVCVISNAESLKIENIIVFAGNFKFISDSLISKGIYFKGLWFLLAYPVVFSFQLILNVMRIVAKNKE